MQSELVKPNWLHHVDDSWVRAVQILEQRGLMVARRDLRRECSDPRQLAKYKREYAEKRRRQSFSLVPIGVLGALLAMGGGSLIGLSERAFLIIVGVVILSFFSFSLLNWRCPSCDAYLGQRLNPRECNSCGAVLRD